MYPITFNDGMAKSIEGYPISDFVSCIYITLWHTSTSTSKTSFSVSTTMSAISIHIITLVFRIMDDDQSILFIFVATQDD